MPFRFFQASSGTVRPRTKILAPKFFSDFSRFFEQYNSKKIFFFSLQLTQRERREQSNQITATHNLLFQDARPKRCGFYLVYVYATATKCKMLQLNFGEILHPLLYTIIFSDANDKDSVAQPLLFSRTFSQILLSQMKKYIHDCPGKNTR